MKKIVQRILIFLSFLFFISPVLFAQNLSIFGTVSNINNEVLPGVNVQIKGTKIGTVTDAKGLFKLGLNSPKDVLVVSTVGFTSQEISVNNRSILNVMLTEDTKSLEEVVVTALGIKREEKSLGFAATSISSHAVVDAKSNNWVNTLSGKVAGLNIQGVGGGPMGSSRITLRGETSLNLENNQALIILDGVPISSKITGTGFTSHLSADSPVDYGSTISDLNPDDIENVTVLKGPGATALYGSRAAGGALVITTKTGARKDNRIGVTFNSNYNIEQVNRYPDYQFEYGEGRTDVYYSYRNSADGINTSTTAAAGRAFGPKFNGQSYFQYDPNTPDNKATERTPWVPYKNYISDFFQTGVTFSNSLSLDGGTDKGSARFSLTHMKNEWIIPNTGFERINAALSVSQQLSSKLKISGKANYTNKRSDNLPAAGYNNQSLMYFLIIGTTPNVNPQWFKPYWLPGLEGVQQKNPFNPGPDNPYLGMYEMLNKMNKNGFIGNITTNYQINKNLDLTVRGGLDMAFEFRNQQRPYSMTKYPKGMYREQNVFNYELNTDFLLTYKETFNKIQVIASAGANAMRQTYDFVGLYADQLAQPGIYQISNSLDAPVSDPLRTKKAINSVYGSTGFAFDEKIFLDLTARNDWSSSLPFGSNSYFYPSVSSSFLLHELFTMPEKVSFAKFRASWAQVGNDTRPYQTTGYYDRIYLNGFTTPSTLFNANLKPEITSSYEFGLDVRLFKNRIGLDVAYFDNSSRNQILAVPLDPTSGYSFALINAGLINSKGIEVKLTAKPVKTDKFSWNITALWSQNRSYVRELAAGITNQTIYSHSGNVTIEAREGGLMGDMYGRGFQRSPDGQIIYGTNGLPAALNTTTKKWGNAFADWKGSLSNEFTYKGLKLSVLIDGQMGGSMYSQTNHKNNTLGKTVVTLPGRDGGLIGEGVVLQADGSYKPNTVKVAASAYYDNYYQISNAEVNIFDATFLKIREVRFEFNLSQKLLGKLGVKGTSLALFGRDLFNFTKFPGFDPEGGNLNNGTITPGVELTQFPSARSMGANLTLKF